MTRWIVVCALAALAAEARDLRPARSRIEIVSTSDSAVVYRESRPLRVAAEPAAGLYHRKDCPAVTAQMEWIAPAAATLRRLRAHSCGARLTAEYATFTAARRPRDERSIAVLFLGNSLTYYNEMPRITEAIASRETRPLRIDAVTRSGISLEQLWNDTEARKRLWLDHWDYVVLQGGAGSSHPLYNADEFHRYLKLFDEDVRRSGATPLFYSTWRPQQTREHEAASRAAAARVSMRVVPAGAAWIDLVERGRFRRLDWDGLHPDARGAYLVACSVYSTIYGKPAHGARHEFRHFAVKSETYDDALRTQTISADEARAIQDAAWRAVRGVNKQ